MLRRRHERTRVISTLFVFLFTSALAAAADGASLDRFLERKMRRARVPGMAVAVLVDGQLAWTEGYGWADVEKQVPVTPDTLFLIGSVSKPVTATGVMWLHEQQGLDLDADVSQYLPFEVQNPSFPDHPMTLRHLLTHTSSISDQRSGHSQVWYEIVSTGDWPGSLTQFLIDYLTPGGRYYDPAACFHNAAPGSRFEYSNVGYTLLAAVVEHVTGSSFEDFHQQATLGPLEMTESSWFLGYLDPDRVAVPYTWNSGSYEPYPHYGAAFFPAGMLRTSARQLANFASLHLRRGKFHRRRILRRRTAREMMRIQYPEIAPGSGLGFGIGEVDEWRFATHAGAFYGCSTFLLLELNDKLGVIVLTNGEPYLDLPGKPALPRQKRAMEKIIERLFREARRMAEAD